MVAQIKATPEKVKVRKLSLSPQEAAKSIGISVVTMYRWCKLPDFPAIHAGRKIIIPIREFENWLASNCGRSIIMVDDSDPAYMEG